MSTRTSGHVKALACPSLSALRLGPSPTPTDVLLQFDTQKDEEDWNEWARNNNLREIRFADVEYDEKETNEGLPDNDRQQRSANGKVKGDVISQAEFVEGEELIVLSNGHVYNRAELARWFRSRKTRKDPVDPSYYATKTELEELDLYPDEIAMAFSRWNTPAESPVPDRQGVPQDPETESETAENAAVDQLREQGATLWQQSFDNDNLNFRNFVHRAFESFVQLETAWIAAQNATDRNWLRWFVLYFYQASAGLGSVTDLFSTRAARDLDAWVLSFLNFFYQTFPQIQTLFGMEEQNIMVGYHLNEGARALIAEPFTGTKYAAFERLRENVSRAFTIAEAARRSTTTISESDESDNGGRAATISESGESDAEADA